MSGSYELSKFSNIFLDRIGEIYYSSIGKVLPADFSDIKQSYVNISNININSYEDKLNNKKKLGYYDESISEIANDFVKYLGSTNYWEIIRKGEKLYLRKIGGSLDESNILYPPSTLTEKALSLFSPSPRGSVSSSPRGSSQFTTPSSSPRGLSQFTTPSSSPKSQEVSLDDFLKNSNNSNKGGKKKSKRRKTKRRKSRKGKSKRSK